MEHTFGGPVTRTLFRPAPYLAHQFDDSEARHDLTLLRTRSHWLRVETALFEEPNLLHAARRVPAVFVAAP